MLYRLRIDVERVMVKDLFESTCFVHMFAGTQNLSQSEIYLKSQKRGMRKSEVLIM
jgi:hypothetical protein